MAVFRQTCGQAASMRNLEIQLSSAPGRRPVNLGHRRSFYGHAHDGALS